ncbi:MAG: peptidylprolyl isomerase [Gammaproteobacteria bacterium]|nr:peptidylprolyl isomerase [Gammaproteobacteria bacterium]MCZ6498671.1 peptidylprolyl isomerase [Gammaproteobacteria bacterium]
MKIIVYSAAFLMVAGLAPSQSWSQTRELGAAGELLDGVAAVVDNGIVLTSELETRVAVVLENMRLAQRDLPLEQQRPLPPLSILEEQVLEQLILQRIQLQRAERFGIVVSDEVLNQALTSIAQDIGLTLESLPSALAAENIDYAMYRQDTREQMILDQLQQRDVYAGIVVSPREMELCLERSSTSLAEDVDYDISHILIGLPSSATQDALTDANAQVAEIYARLDDGDEFSQLAITFSDGQTALEGGSLGWRKGYQLPTLFGDIVIAMEPGEVSEPIQSGSGFHIVRLNDTRGAQVVIVDQLRVRHILLRPNEIMDADAVRQRLLGIREQILAGDEFAPIAQAVSEDPGSAAEGGDLGWVEAGVFVPEFEQMLNSLELDQLSEPFETRFGWHIAEVTDTRSYDTTEEIKEQRCADQIRASKVEEERELWLRRLRDQAFVETRL